MNREIKFRGKSLNGGFWVYGDLMTKHVHHQHAIIESGVIAHAIDPYTAGQYTGLKDKSGMDIYEGDLLKIITMSGRVEFFLVKYGIHRREMKNGFTVDIPSFAFVSQEGLFTFPIVDNYQNGHDLDIIEVVGNMFDNPKLFKPAPEGQ